jgi:NADPH:quinone reductase
MRAVLCRQWGPPESLRLEDVAPPALAADQVRIAVRACGVNFPDLLIIEGKYQIKPELPFTPGHELSGTVTEAGPAVQGFKAGDRVLATVGFGAFAEEAVAPAAQVMALPAGMDDTTAAAFGIVYGTSYHALVQRARLREGEVVLVLGAGGGVGLSAVEVAKALGATVIAAAGGDEKLAAAREHGADHLVDSRRESVRERVEAITGKRGADVIYDPVGGEAFDEGLRCLAWEGRLLVVGFASGRIPQAPVNRLLLKSQDLVGVHWGAWARRDPEANRRNFEALFRWHAEGRLRPRVWRTHPLDRVADALKAVQERQVVGKVVLTT